MTEERVTALRDVVYETILEHDSVVTKDLIVTKRFYTDGDGILHKKYRARERYRVDAHVWLAETYDVTETIILARQKLAAEREAAMSPNERKYKAALESIVASHSDDPQKVSCGMSVGIAKEALKEST